MIFALLGAVGQAVGLVLSKHGMKSYDPFAATYIRINSTFAALYYKLVAIINYLI